MAKTSSMLAIEVGSSRVKLGWFPAASACTSEKPAGNLPIAAPALPEPAEIVRIDHCRDEQLWIADAEASLAALNLPPDATCVVAAVHQAAAGVLVQRVLVESFGSRLHTLTRRDIAMEANVSQPDRVGIDRLLNALAVNCLRDPRRPAIVVDMGTAITVNLISANGVFEGGAILAGPTTALAALHTATSSLPFLGLEAFATTPSPVGKSTVEAMASGAYWGAVGAAQQLIERICDQLAVKPDLFLTGGAAGPLAAHVRLGHHPARHIPHLVLSGILLAADGKCAT